MYFSIFGISPNAVPCAESAASSSLDFFAFLSVSSFDLAEFVVAFVFPVKQQQIYVNIVYDDMNYVYISDRIGIVHCQRNWGMLNVYLHEK